jgi:hypothetical protein
VVNDNGCVSVSNGAPVLPGTETSREGKGGQPDFPAKAGEEFEFIKRLIAKKQTVSTFN